MRARRRTRTTRAHVGHGGRRGRWSSASPPGRIPGGATAWREELELRCGARPSSVGDQLALAHDDDAVAEPDQLVAARTTRRRWRCPSSARSRDQPVDLGLARRRRRRASARRAAARGTRAAASARARPSAGCRRRARARAGRAVVGHGLELDRSCSAASARARRARSRNGPRDGTADSPATRHVPGQRPEPSSRPCDLRSSGASPMPAAIAASGRPPGSRLPSSCTTSPSSGARAP